MKGEIEATVINEIIELLKKIDVDKEKLDRIYNRLIQEFNK
ncbi:MAG: hypothetical protein Unbinned3907contig1000_32 [Prokaryotic dsDNA virus sp.]|nr:MAG: hypothetical protein Unbinned3907contig1000_32 [Prokaryotic dsDNA virus sp.]|tara:strand:- start:1343 stop:1465 length:123 start_codon:yes stop_codon:yes gene_type:complete